VSVGLSQNKKYAQAMEMQAASQRKNTSLAKPVPATITEVSTNCGVKDPSGHTSCETYRQDRDIRRRAFKRARKGAPAIWGLV